MFSISICLACFSREALKTVFPSGGLHYSLTPMFMDFTRANFLLQKGLLNVMTLLIPVEAFLTLAFTDCRNMSDTERVSLHLRVVSSFGLLHHYLKESFLFDCLCFAFVWYFIYRRTSVTARAV